jgi:transposase
MARLPVYARPPSHTAEGRRLRKLAKARNAPASSIQRARIVTGSWDGASVPELAERLGCHRKTVYKWLRRFNAHGVAGLADLSRPGVPRRINELDRRRIVALAHSQPPGKPVTGGEGRQAPACPGTRASWTLDALTRSAQAEGIRVGRSQVRRILLAEAARRRRPPSWMQRTDPALVGGEPGSSSPLPYGRQL